MKNFLELCEARFAARKFTDEPVSDDDIEFLKTAVRLAPSAANCQPWRFLIVRSDEGRAKLRQCYSRAWFNTAPMYLVAFKSIAECWVRHDDGKLYADFDLGIAVEHFCLAATERGLGSCCVAHYDTRKLRDLFPEDGLEAVAIVPFGHVAADCERTPKVRKSMADIFREV